MVFPLIDTPRTEAGDQTRLSHAGELDFTTQSSIPSPSKDSNNLLNHLRGVRNPGITTPRGSRAPFGDRHNVPSKNEFTPLLKSAARNNFRRSYSWGKENKQLQTPAGLRAQEQNASSPALPEHSSMLQDNYTTNSIDEDEEDGTPVPLPQASSSSVLSTPMVMQNGRGEGPLSNGGSLATLREQEMRLNDLGKENFSLKLKIHFLEEAMRKSGKDFNEAALKENTELKVDKVTLQREVKQFKKSMSQAEKELEEYKCQLSEYMEKLKRRQSADGAEQEAHQEIAQLQQMLDEREAELKSLREKAETAENNEEQIQRLRDDVEDLEAELRQREQELDEKDERLQNFKQDRSSDQEQLHQRLEELQDALEDKDEEISELRNSVDSAKSDNDRRAQEYKQSLLAKDEELQQLRANAKSSSQQVGSQVQDLNNKLQEKVDALADFDKKLASRDAAISDLKNQLNSRDADISDLNNQLKSRDATASTVTTQLDSKAAAIADLNDKLQAREMTIADLQSEAEAHFSNLQDLQNQLEHAKTTQEAETRRHHRTLEERDLQVHKLEQKLQAAEGRDEESEKLHDRISDLEAELRDKDAELDSKDDDIDALQLKVREAGIATDDELQMAYDELGAAKEQITKLESGQARGVKQLQELRDAEDEASAARRQALDDAQRRIREMTDRASEADAREQRLRADLAALQGKADSLANEVRDRESDAKRRDDSWNHQRRSLELAKSRADEEAEGLRQTVKMLQETHGTSSGREAELRKVLESESERHEMLRKALQKELDAASKESEQRRSMLDDARSEVESLRREAEKQQSRQTELQRQVQDLQDEVEVLQMGLDDEAAAAREECEKLKEQLRRAKQDLTKAHSDYEALNAELDAGQPGPDNNVELASMKKENSSLKTSLRTTETELETLRGTLADLESTRSTVERTAHDLRIQLQTQRRESDRKLQTQTAAYEQDIHNLEQDIEDARAKQATLTSANEKAEQNASRLRSRIQELETQLVGAKATKPGADADERKDLHAMLKDAKLEAEDLAMQLGEREGRLAKVSEREQQLRSQLQRVREERNTQTARAGDVAKELEAVQAAHDRLVEEVAQLQMLQRQVRFPKAGSPEQQDQDMKQARRHAAELRGLVKQIEYLSARCRREEGFRQDLGFVKSYFTKLVEMHGRCTTADLKLVSAMGVPTDAVLAAQVAEMEARAPGRVVKKLSMGSKGQMVQLTRPSLRCVVLMVRASVRMRAAAEQWRTVRKNHDRLLGKLPGSGMKKTGVAQSGSR